jgi:hypothetical protein
MHSFPEYTKKTTCHSRKYRPCRDEPSSHRTIVEYATNSLTYRFSIIRGLYSPISTSFRFGEGGDLLGCCPIVLILAIENRFHFFSEIVSGVRAANRTQGNRTCYVSCARQNNYSQCSTGSYCMLRRKDVRSWVYND